MLSFCPVCGAVCQPCFLAEDLCDDCFSWAVEIFGGHSW